MPIFECIRWLNGAPVRGMIMQFSMLLGAPRALPVGTMSGLITLLLAVAAVDLLQLVGHARRLGQPLGPRQSLTADHLRVLR